MEKKTFLIADSGSTKTDWLLCGAEGETCYIQTQGINPYMLTDDEIGVILRDELLPALPVGQLSGVYFYGAGCRGEQLPRLRSLLSEQLPTDGVEAASDLLGAARALCGRAPGLAAILGTGSNSCFYDGTNIVDNVSPLGFILGDEGSGASLGKRLVGDVLKRRMPESLHRSFYEETGETLDHILNRVYKQTFPNRFLAGFTRFLHAHRDAPEIRQLLIDEFERFFRRNIDAYAHPELPVAFVGSVAHYFADELSEAARNCGYTVGEILRSPLEGLRKYHG